jgi:hypothetical protein
MPRCMRQIAALLPNRPKNCPVWSPWPKLNENSGLFKKLEICWNGWDNNNCRGATPFAQTAKYRKAKVWISSIFQEDPRPNLLNVILLNAILLCVILLNAILLCVILLNAILLCVILFIIFMLSVIPFKCHSSFCCVLPFKCHSSFCCVILFNNTLLLCVILLNAILLCVSLFNIILLNAILLNVILVCVILFNNLQLNVTLQNAILLCVILQNSILLCVILLNAILLCVILLIIFMLSVIPFKCHSSFYCVILFNNTRLLCVILFNNARLLCVILLCRCAESRGAVVPSSNTLNPLWRLKTPEPPPSSQFYKTDFFRRRRTDGRLK